MANITFPAVKMTEMDLEAIIPNVIRHQSIYTGREIIHSRGNLQWRVRVQIPRVNVKQHPQVAQAMEAFCLQVFGQVNTFDIPLQQVDQTSRFLGSAPFIINNIVSDFQTSRFEVPQLGLQQYDYINISGKLYQITEVAANQLTVYPAITTGTLVEWYRPYLRARILGEAILSPRRGYWAGPWSFEAIEAT